MKIRLKTTDSKQDIIMAIKSTEEKFPDLEIVHPSNAPRGQYAIYDLEKEEYVKPLTEDIPFIKEFRKQLEEINYDIFKVRGKDLFDFQLRGPSDMLNRTWDPEEIEKQEEEDLMDYEYEEERTQEDTRWNYGEATANKLEDFLARYGRYLVDEDARLVYKRNRGLWGPVFSYKRDDDGADANDIPTTEIKQEIYQYIDREFFGN